MRNEFIYNIFLKDIRKCQMAFESHKSKRGSVYLAEIKIKSETIIIKYIGGLKNTS